MLHHRSRTAGVIIVATAAALTGCRAASTPSASTPTSTRASAASTAAAVTVSITGGLDTVAGDNGRPIVLVAGLLGVAPAVFRKAFSSVTPANPASGPTTEEAQRNKAALLAVLSPYGITNDALDHASNSYRYNAATGRLWPHTSATATAIVSNGTVTGFEIIDAGSGYTSPPSITLSNGQTATATLAYGKNVAMNGSITAITLR